MRSEGSLNEKRDAYENRWLRASYFFRWLLEWWGVVHNDDDDPQPQG